MTKRTQWTSFVCLPEFFLDDFHISIKALFSNIVAFGKKKLIVIVFMLIYPFIFEKRAANLIRMYKIALTTLKSAFRF